MRDKNEDDDGDDGDEESDGKEGADEEGESGGMEYRIGDSGLIIKHLVDLNVLRDLNVGLGAEAKLQNLSIRALLEEKL